MMPEIWGNEVNWIDKIFSWIRRSLEISSCILQGTIVLPEIVTNGSMFSFVLYGKDSAQKIQTNREYVEQN